MLSTHRILSAGLLTLCCLVGGSGCTTSSSEDGQGGDTQAVSGTGERHATPTSGRFERWERIDMAKDGQTFLSTEVDPVTAKQKRGTYPEKYAIEVDGTSFWRLA